MHQPAEGCVSNVCACGVQDLDEIGQAQVDAASFLQDFHVADGDVRHDGQHQRLQRLVEAVRETLGPRHLMIGMNT